MATMLDEIIALYASQPIGEAIDESVLEKNFGKSVDELSKDWYFPAQRILVEDLQAKLKEAVIDTNPTGSPAVEVSQSLKLLFDLALAEAGPQQREQKLNILSELARRRFSSNWSDAQRKHFDFVLQRIKAWNCFFLSYTNSGATHINKSYADVIGRSVDKEARKKMQNDNLLAESLIRHLVDRHNLKRAFYDKRDVKPGDDLSAKIGPACRNSFAFLQLIQLDTFNAVKPNWSYEEYTQFDLGNKEVLKENTAFQQLFVKRFTAVVAADQVEEVKPAHVPLDYRGWFTRALTPQRFEYLPRKAQPFEAKMKEVANEIIRFIYSIIESVPA